MACDESVWNEDGSLKAAGETTTETTQLDFAAKGNNQNDLSTFPFKNECFLKVIHFLKFFYRC